MHIGTVHTKHFKFVGFGETLEQAQTALREAWRKHCEQYPEADPGLMEGFITEDEVDWILAEPGDVFRNGALFIDGVQR